MHSRGVKFGAEDFVLHMPLNNPLILRMAASYSRLYKTQRHHPIIDITGMHYCLPTI